MKYTATALCALALSASAATAAVVDFENEAPLNPDPTLIPVGNSYVNGGITFTSTETMQLVGTGIPTNAFVPNDTPGTTASGAPADFGEVFLTGDFNRSTNMFLSFASTSYLSFDIVGIDGSGGDNNEVFTFTASDNFGNVLSETMMSGNASTPAGQVDRIEFSGIGLLSSILITGDTAGGLRNVGWGIDNISNVADTSDVAPVPVPAGGILLLTAFGAMGALRRRKRAS